MKINFQFKLDEIINRHKHAAEAPTLLLHSCCGPCSSYVLEYLSNHFKITLLYYNPNIAPEMEYLRRLETQKKLLSSFNGTYPVRLLEGEYNPEIFDQAVRGLEHEPEGGERCTVCFRLRLEEAAHQGKNLGTDYFTTTLSVSPHKDSQTLNWLGEELSEKYGVAHLPADFKKRGGYQRSILLSGEYGLYRQDYCGCIYSKRDSDR